MKTKQAVVATLLGGLVIFVWGALAHMLPPEPVTVLADPVAVDQFLAKNAPRNGVYMDVRGVMVVVGLLPDRSDKSVNMGPQLGIEFVTDIVQAFVLFLIFLRFRQDSLMSYGIAGALLGLLSWVAIDVSYWNWYSFSMPLVLMGLLDAIGGFFLAGLIVGWQIRKSA